MRKLLLVFLALPCFAAISTPRVSDTTAREAILRYVAPTPASCTVEVSESASYSPLVNDVNPGLFAGSNSDFRNGAQGRERTFVIGGAGAGIDYAPVDTTGKRSSRALQANTLHYYRVTCGVDVISGTFNTANIAPGDTFPRTTAPIDPNYLGEVAWPFLPWSGPTGVIDPVTGLFMQRLQRLNAEHTSNNSGLNTFNWAYDDTANWTNKANILADDGILTTFTGSSNDPLRIATSTRQDTPYSMLVGLTLVVHGFVDAPTTTAEACLMIDGATCYGPWIPIPALPVGSLGSPVNVGDPNVNSGSTNPTPAMLAAWLSPNQKLPTPYDTSARTGGGDNVGSALTLRVNAIGSFDYRWTPSTHIIYDGVDYTVASVQSGTSLTLSGSPANASQKSWVAANFGFMIRKSSAGGTLNIDSAKFYYNLYNSQQTNGGSGGSKQCTSTRYHEGWRIGGAHNSATNAATNTSPIVMTTTTAHDFVTGDVVTQTGVPGNTAANGTFTITKLSSTTYSLNGSTGNGTFPSDVNEAVYYGGGGLAWKSTSATGHFCTFASGTNEVQLYWINPDSTPADVRYLGPAWTVNSGKGWLTNPNVGTFDETDPNVPTAYNLITNGGGKQEVIKGKYMGNQLAGMFRDVGPETYGGGGDTTNIWSWTSITPAPNTLSDLFAAFDPSSAGMTVSIGRIQKPGLLTVSNTLGIQNSMGWLGVFNVNTGTVVGLMNSWSNSNARYCGIHTPLPWEGADMYSWVPYELTGRDSSNQTNNNGPYRMLSTGGALSNTASDCATQLTAIGKPNPLNITGNSCTTVTVSSNIPITPANYIPANDTRNNTVIQIGDTLRIYTASGGVSGVGVYDNELVRIVNFNGNTLVIQRGVGGDGIAAHVSGFYLHEFCSVIPRWWDYTNAPHGSTGADPYNQFLSGNILDVPFQAESHYFTRGGFSVSDTTTAADLATLSPPFVCPSTVYSGLSAPYGYRNYPWPNHVSAPTSAYGCVQGDPLFDGVHGNGQGDYLEKHPSPVNNFAVNPSWFDARPYATLTDWQQTVTQLGTYIFKVTGYNHFENFDEKRNMLYVMVGHHTALDVSSPGFTLPDTTAYNYTYCLAHVANECRAGSSVGDVYVNAPYVSKVPLGWPYNPGQYRCQPKHENWSDLQLNDVCVAIQSPYADFAVQYSGANDPYNTGARRITSALSFPRTTNNLWNAPVLPNGDWQINLTDSVNYGARPIMFLVKLPPYTGPQRGVNRGSWIPVQLKISTVPAGTASAMVEFGYNPNLYCSTRQEVCVANTASLQTGGSVYAYETSDNPSGLPCTSGCTITIPALSQRMMWHRVVYRNSAGSVISQGPVSVLATP